MWGAFVGIFGPDRLNNRWEVGAKSPKIMTMVGDSGACMRVKQYSPHTYTEQPYLDWIKRFIHFHGKRHRQRSRPTFGT